MTEASHQATAPAASSLPENFVGRPTLNRDTTVCISLSGRPSNHGIKFHNYLYEKFGLDFLYKAMTTTDIQAAIGGVRALDVRGCSVSMPFKQDVIPLMDEIDHSAKVIGAVNTIVNTDGYLHAYNTDVIAVASLLKSHAVDPNQPTFCSAWLRRHGARCCRRFLRCRL